MPDVVGKSLTETIKMLNNLGISYEIDGDGGTVERQLPPAGTNIDLNSTVVLITN